ncbi:RNA polymerase sigma factor [Mariniphaga sediminis]|uniref:RNA polymerase sigma factor n=1 Tax=Mariniphaga sediminis TaxID=1628158 RepID=UPI003564B543
MKGKIKKQAVDEALVKRFTGGDMQAFDDIYAAFSYKLQKFIFTLVKTETDTEDLIQEVFVKLWENKNKLKNTASFETYLFTIAYNTTISFLRNKAKDIQYVEYVKSVQIELSDFSLIDEINKEEVYEKIHLLIEKMPPRQREVFKMKHFKNYSYKEIAEALNISVNTVENHMVKAHKYLKESLGKAYLLALFFVHLFL